jgi:hypothetical protein
MLAGIAMGSVDGRQRHYLENLALRQAISISGKSV